MSSPIPGDRLRDLPEHTAPPADGDAIPFVPDGGTMRRWPWSRLGAAVQAMIERIVPSWARAATPPQIHTSGGDLPALPEDGETYTLQGRDPTGASPAIRFWTHMGGRSLQVADTADPGDSDRPAREDHVHNLPLNEDHLQFDGSDLEFSQAIQDRLARGSETGATPQRGDTLPLNPAEGREFFLDRDWHQPSTQHILAFQPQAYSGGIGVSLVDATGGIFDVPETTRQPGWLSLTGVAAVYQPDVHNREVIFLVEQGFLNSFHLAMGLNHEHGVIDSKATLSPSGTSYTVGGRTYRAYVHGEQPLVADHMYTLSIQSAANNHFLNGSGALDAGETAEMGLYESNAARMWVRVGSLTELEGGGHTSQQLAAKQNRRQIIEVFPSELTDQMLGATFSFLFTLHLNVADIPAGATHFAARIGTHTGRVQPISDIPTALFAGPLQTFVTVDQAQLRSSFLTLISNSVVQNRFLQASVAFYDGPSGINVVDAIQPIQIPLLTEAPLTLSTSARVFPQVDSTRQPGPLQDERAVELSYGRGSYATVLLDRPVQFSLDSHRAAEGNIMTVRFVRPPAIENVPYVAHPFQFRTAGFTTFPGSPVPTINNGAGESTILRFFRTGNTWYHLGRADSVAGPGSGGVDQTARDDAAEALAAARAAADLRTRIDTAATPVAADRFFFTDENISGDPLRYVDYRGLVRALIPDVAGLLISDPASPLAASADTIDKVVFRGGRLYRTVHQHGTDPTVSYRSFATADLPGGYTWGGAHQVDPSPASLAINTVIYSIPGAHFLRRVSLGGTAYWGGYNPANWRGPFGSESEADAHVSAVGDIVYFGGIVRVVTAVTARTPDAYHYQAIVEARTWQAKTATNNGTRQWTYTLEAEDTELWIGGPTATPGNPPPGKSKGLHSGTIPRAVLMSSSAEVVLDSRVPSGTVYPDANSAGVTASISGSVVTLSTVDWADIGTPVVYSK